MHQMSIAESLVDLIEDEGRARGFSRVKQIHVKLGALGHVEPEALRFCFDTISHGTIAEGAALALEAVANAGWSAAGSGLRQDRILVPERLEHLPLGLSHPSEKKMLKIKELEHVLIGKVGQLFRNMLESGMRKLATGFSRPSRSNSLESIT
jgi:hydrogenase nickel insertion protein HypA